MIRRPRAIACCSGPADVQAAVRFAAEEGVYPVRGGGHNAAGLAMLDDGLVIDVSGMKGIFVEPVERTVIAQTGLTCGEFDRETHVHGMATTVGLIVLTNTGSAKTIGIYQGLKSAVVPMKENSIATLVWNERRLG